MLLGLVGQLAWTVENMYLNVFVYETISDDPQVLAVLVAASALTATLATLVVFVALDPLTQAGEWRTFFGVVGAAKELGFTMVRKHIKVQSLRWYHHCDRVGLLVWQDMVNGGGPPPRAGRRSVASSSR